MLSHNAKMILHAAQKYGPVPLEFTLLGEKTSLDDGYVRRACAQLVEQGFASYAYAGKYVHGISLKEEGADSLRYAVTKAIDFLFRSIAVPIIVAVLTAIIATWVMLKIWGVPPAL